jgi:hypothetical protein
LRHINPTPFKIESDPQISSGSQGGKMFSKALLVRVTVLLAVLMIVTALAVSAAPDCHLTGFSTKVSSGAYPSSIVLGQSVHDNATFTLSEPARLKGHLDFSVCGPTVGIAPCSTGGTALTAVAVDVTTTYSTLTQTFSSPNFTPVAPGTYCFRVNFTAESGNGYSFDTVSFPHVGGNTDTKNECVNVTTTPSAVTLSSLTARSEGTGHTALVVIGMVVAGMLGIVFVGSRKALPRA